MSEPDPDPAVLRAAIFEIIEIQMHDGNPPETKQTYDRLIAAGHTHEETMKLIGCVVASESFDVVKQKLPYNQERYVAALQSLPELPWDDDDDD